jgi:hypothetical protein
VKRKPVIKPILYPARERYLRALLETGKPPTPVGTSARAHCQAIGWSEQVWRSFAGDELTWDEMNKRAGKTMEERRAFWEQGWRIAYERITPAGRAALKRSEEHGT